MGETERPRLPCRVPRPGVCRSSDRSDRWTPGSVVTLGRVAGIDRPRLARGRGEPEGGHTGAGGHTDAAGHVRARGGPLIGDIRHVDHLLARSATTARNDKPCARPGATVFNGPSYDAVLLARILGCVDDAQQTLLYDGHHVL